jgi:hypothetical protein
MEGLALECDNRAEELAETEQMIGVVTKAMQGEIRKFAELLVSKEDKDLLGRGEFELRGILMQAGARALEAAINDRKKRGTKAAV